jgi:hypothetical protein
MTEGFESVGIYITTEVVIELGEALKVLKERNATVGGALYGFVRPIKNLNDTIEYLIEAKLTEGSGYND